MYMNAKSWEPWVERAEAAGFETVAPSWPYHDGEPAELRRHIDPQLGRLTFGRVVRHFADVIGTISGLPLVVGHSSGRIHFRRQHVPLLMIAGDTDHLCPLPAVRRNAKRYQRSAGLTRFQAFPGRSHFICNQEGWEEIANACFDFLRAALA
jgi:hypothetical protein